MSSYFDDASLVMIPSGYKTSKVYSVKPTDGTGDLTFTRSNDTATRVGPDGLIEKVRTNLLLQSETFDNASWLKTRATITANATTAPDGTSTADKMIANTDNNSHFVDQPITTPTNIPFTFSVFAKAGEYDFLQINNQADSSIANFNLSNGTLGTISGYEASITDAGNGWYRCVATRTFSSAPTTHRFALITSSTSARLESFIGDGTSGLFLWGCQAETGDIATEPILTTTAAVSVGPVANVPRLDYLNSSCPRLLLEPTATAFNRNSENAAGWSLIGSSVTSNQTTAPDGYNGGDLITYASTGARIQQDVTFTDTKATLSVFVKGNSGNGCSILIRNVTTSTNIAENYFNGNTFTPQSGTYSATSTSYGNGWYRISITVTSGITSGNALRAYVYTDVISGTISGSSVYVWGMNLTNTSYLQSYIPTLGAAVTRGLDAASKTGISSLIGQTEGTLFAEFEVPANTQDGDIIAIRNGTGSANGIFVSYRSSSVVQLIVRTGSTNALIFQRTGSYAIGTNKIAVAYKNGDFAISLNGTAAQVNTSSITMPTSLDSVGLFGNNMYAQTLPMPYAQALLFKTRLSNADLAALTA